MSLQEQNLFTLHVQVHLTCVKSAEIGELKISWDNEQNRAELRDIVIVPLGLKA